MLPDGTGQPWIVGAFSGAGFCERYSNRRFDCRGAAGRPADARLADGVTGYSGIRFLNRPAFRIHFMDRIEKEQILHVRVFVEDGRFEDGLAGRGRRG
jgi:hypothetical protein